MPIEDVERINGNADEHRAYQRLSRMCTHRARPTKWPTPAASNTESAIQIQTNAEHRNDDDHDSGSKGHFPPPILVFTVNLEMDGVRRRWRGRRRRGNPQKGMGTYEKDADDGQRGVREHRQD